MRTYPIAFKAEGKFWVNNHAHIVQPRDGISLDYLLHYWATVDLTPYISGSAQPKLSQKNLNNVLVPLPPHLEQYRLAVLIGEQMAAVEQARAAAQTQLDAAERLMAAYLREVFDGEEAKGWKCIQLVVHHTGN